MKNRIAVRCAQRTSKPDPITDWARDLVARPARYGATERERAMVAVLLSQVEVAR